MEKSEEKIPQEISEDELQEILEDALQEELWIMEKKRTDDMLSAVKKDVDSLLDEIEGNSKVEKAEKILKEILEDDELQEELRIREKHRMDYNNNMIYAWEKGFREGFEESFKKSFKKGERGYTFKVAKNLLSMGMQISDIQEVTGLTKKEIEKLARAEG